MELNVLQLRILNSISVYKKPVVRIAQIKPGLLGVCNAEELQLALNKLSEKGLIKLDGTDIFINEDGNNFIADFNNYEKELVFNKEYELVILKFLYEMNEAVPYFLFPKLLKDNIAQSSTYTGGDAALMNYIEYDSKLRPYIICKSQQYALSDAGKLYYENQLKKIGQKENIQNLEMEKLVFEVNQLRQDFSDYPKTKSNAKKAINISILAIIITILLQIIQWKCKG